MDLELKIISATDLQKSNLFSSKLHPYVVVSISGATSETKKTPLDNDDGRNPTWNHALTFSVLIGESDDLILRFQIRSRRSIAADKLVGEVFVPLRNLIESASGGKTRAPANFVSYQVKKPSGRPKGVLTFSYRFNGKISGAVATEEPVMNYPMKPQPTSTVYPTSAPLGLYPPLPKPEPVTGYPAVDVYPPPVAAMQTSYGYPAYRGYGYGYPTQMGYGYPDQAGYGYGPYGSGYEYEYGGQVVQLSTKKSGGLGLGAGLLGGAVAGVLISDLVSDVGFD